MSQASSASSCGCSSRRRCAYSALRSAVVKLPDDPSPVPEGMSASVVISTCGVRKPSILIASRMIGCWTSSAFSTCSSFEYFR